MNIVVLGASGLIGHTLVRELASSFNVIGFLHKPITEYHNSFFSNYSFEDNVDVLNFSYLSKKLIEVHPDVILNCTGITRRKISKGNIVEAIEVNAAFPHKLARFASSIGARVIQFSTDCVFNGKGSNYTEQSPTTAEDLYGKTKAIGELQDYDNALTIRSSFVGQELFDKTELLDWFLAQEGKSITGYRKTLYSGVSTVFMTQAIKKIILDYPNLCGLYQLAAEMPISKYDLLCLARKEYGLNVEIRMDEDHIHTPTLNGKKLRVATSIVVPEWSVMMKELATHKSEYLKY